MRVAWGFVVLVPWMCTEINASAAFDADRQLLDEWWELKIRGISDLLGANRQEQRENSRRLLGYLHKVQHYSQHLDRAILTPKDKHALRMLNTTLSMTQDSNTKLESSVISDVEAAADWKFTVDRAWPDLRTYRRLLGALDEGTLTSSSARSTPLPPTTSGVSTSLVNAFAQVIFVTPLVFTMPFL